MNLKMFQIPCFGIIKEYIKSKPFYKHEIWDRIVLSYKGIKKSFRLTRGVKRDLTSFFNKKVIHDYFLQFLGIVVFDCIFVNSRIKISVFSTNNYFYKGDRIQVSENLVCFCTRPCNQSVIGSNLILRLVF